MKVPANLYNLNNWIQLTTIVALAGVVAWSVIRIHAQALRRDAILVRLFALELLVIGVCLGVDSLINSRYPMIFAVIASAVLTFFGLLLYFIGSTPADKVKDRDVRTAIAAAITIMYLVLAGYGVFLVENKVGKMDPLANTLMTTLSTVVGVVVAFYFGSSAYIEAKRTSRREPEEKSEGEQLSK